MVRVRAVVVRVRATAMVACGSTHLQERLLARRLIAAREHDEAPSVQQRLGRLRAYARVATRHHGDASTCDVGRQAWAIARDDVGRRGRRRERESAGARDAHKGKRASQHSSSACVRRSSSVTKTFPGTDRCLAKLRSRAWKPVARPKETGHTSDEGTMQTTSATTARPASTRQHQSCVTPPVQPGKRQ